MRTTSSCATSPRACPSGTPRVCARCSGIPSCARRTSTSAARCSGISTRSPAAAGFVPSRARGDSGDGAVDQRAPSADAADRGRPRRSRVHERVRAAPLRRPVLGAGALPHVRRGRNRIARSSTASPTCCARGVPGTKPPPPLSAMSPLSPPLTARTSAERLLPVPARRCRRPRREGRVIGSRARNGHPTLSLLAASRARVRAPPVRGGGRDPRPDPLRRLHPLRPSGLRPLGVHGDGGASVRLHPDPVGAPHPQAVAPPRPRRFQPRAAAPTGT